MSVFTPCACVRCGVKQDPHSTVQGVALPSLSYKDWNVEQYLGRLHLIFFSSPLAQTGVLAEGLQVVAHGLL